MAYLFYLDIFRICVIINMLTDKVYFKHLQTLQKRTMLELVGVKRRETVYTLS
jgi:hypothetical protein